MVQSPILLIGNMYNLAIYKVEKVGQAILYNSYIFHALLCFSKCVRNGDKRTKIPSFFEK